MRQYKYPVKKYVVCMACQITFENTTKKAWSKCPICGKTKQTNGAGFKKNFANAHPEIIKERARKNDLRYRMTALSMVGRGVLKCNNCGCTDIKCLEINHVNGGGRKESKENGGNRVLYARIALGRRKVDDLDILCRVCNAKHALELKYGPLPYEIRWASSKPCSTQEGESL